VLDGDTVGFSLPGAVCGAYCQHVDKAGEPEFQSRGLRALAVNVE
jgi:hypothetical protein